MKATRECYPCLANLVRQATELATDDRRLRVEAIDRGLKLLGRKFSTGKTSIAVATVLHRVVREVTGNADPYSRMKEAEVELARGLRRGWHINHEGSIRDLIVLAVRGNNIDFFKDMKQIKEGMRMPVEFAIDDIPKLERKLAKVENILYLADNAGEVFFDLPLVERLEDFAPVTYVMI
jgi:uncharacterized protein with ATP-grasp and redox domains